MTKPDQSQIDAEISLLQTVANSVSYSEAKLVRAQIDFLKGTLDPLSDSFEKAGEAVTTAVMDAEDWLEGQTDKAPSLFYQ